MKPTKIAIIGLPGGGKSTFAHFLSKKTKIPVFHLDKYIYDPGWVQRGQQSIESIQNWMINQSTWIIDGNNIPSLELRYSTADLVLYLKYSKLLCLYRVVKRFFFKNREIDDRAEGCKERLEWWLIKYIWQFDKFIDPVLMRLKKLYGNTKLIIVHSDRDLEKLEKILIHSRRDSKT